jgi:acetyltransferase-like isoleucine patch superfamily enzyme
MSALYNILYPIIGIVFRLVLRLLPPEGFNRLCAVLPGRLIVEGLRCFGARIGQDVKIAPPVLFHNFSDRAKKPFANLTIGNHVYIGRGAFFDLKEKIVIEERVTLAMGVMIVTHTGLEDSPLRSRVLPDSEAPVTIRRGAYIGARATILEGVEIGECAVAAAGALVTRSIPPYTVYGGVPAREIKTIPPELCL